MKTLIEILQQFSFFEIILFIILLAIAIKELIDFIDWAKQKITKREDFIKDKQKDEQNQEERLTKIEDSIGNLTENVSCITKKVNCLVDSDRDDIKAFITREHHYFCYKMGWIDDYSLDCLEKRFQHYIEENGNSFAETLMNDIRALPKGDPKDEYKQEK